MNRRPRAATTRVVRDPAALFAKAEGRLTRRADVSIVLGSPQSLGPYPRCLSEYLLHWARRSPERPFLLERSRDSSWRGVTYAEALNEVLRIAAWLLTSGISAERPIAILSDNS